MDRHGNHGIVVCNLLDAEATDSLIARLDILRDTGCKISLLNVIENFPSQYYQIPSVQQLWVDWYEKAETELALVARRLNIPPEYTWLAQGNLHRQIEKFMRSQQVDFIITEGNHESCLTDWFHKMCHPHHDTEHKPPMAA